MVACGVEGHGIHQLGWIVDDLHTWRVPEQLAGLVGVHLLLGLDDDALRVRPQGGHAHGRARALDVVGQPEDLFQLPGHLHLLLRVAVLLEGVDLGDDVEGQLVREEFRRGDLPRGRELLDASLELGHALRASPARSLVGRHDDLLEAVLLVKRPQGHGADRRGAVRVGHQGSLGVLSSVDLWHHQGHRVRVPPSRRVVDHASVLRPSADLGRPLRGEVAGHGQEAHLALLRGLERELLHGNVPELLRLHHRAGGALGEEAHLLSGEVAVLKAL
mmetsp:Transcript_38760/g.87997  ORF Transcript_38760/g.87997 Transcript_38760/m.87997 type:complete len:274 (-) Transcript_38760:56-877(-)